MKRLLSARSLVCLLAVAGIGFVGSSYWTQGKAVVAQILLERAWAASLEQNRPVRAWRWADTWPVASLEIPRLGEKLIVLEGATGEAMAFAPGHMSGTPMPGERGTSIIAAHRNTHFEFLKEMRRGDEIRVTGADGAVTLFRVSDRRIVYADSSGLEPSMGNGRLVLVTCYPFGGLVSGPLRFIIVAERQTSGV
jgi:sortase A